MCNTTMDKTTKKTNKSTKQKKKAKLIWNIRLQISAATKTIAAPVAVVNENALCE